MKGKEKKNERLNTYLLILTFLSTFGLLLATEILVDASVRLNRGLLKFLFFLLILQVCIQGIRRQRIALVISMGISMTVIWVLTILYWNRNSVERFYVPKHHLSEASKEYLRKLFVFPRVVVLAGVEINELPPEILKYRILSKDEFRMLQKTLNPKQSRKREDEISLNHKRLKKARFSGISRRFLIILEKNLLSQESYIEAGFHLLE